MGSNDQFSPSFDHPFNLCPCFLYLRKVVKLSLEGVNVQDKIDLISFHFKIRNSPKLSIHMPVTLLFICILIK